MTQPFSHPLQGGPDTQGQQRDCRELLGRGLEGSQNPDAIDWLVAEDFIMTSGGREIATRSNPLLLVG
jgi:hypothetical protein